MKSSSNHKDSSIAAIFYFAKNLDAFRTQGVPNHVQKEMIALFIDINKLIGYLSLTKTDIDQIKNFIKPKTTYEEYKKLKRALELHYKNNSDLNTIAIDIGENIAYTNRLLQHGMDYILDNLKLKDFKASSKPTKAIVTNAPKPAPQTQVRVTKKKKSGFWGFVRTLMFFGLLFYGGKYIYENYLGGHAGTVQKLVNEYRSDGNLAHFAKPSASGRLRVDGPTHILRSITELEVRLKSGIPNLELETHDSNSSESIQKLLNEQIDIAATSRMPTVDERRQSQKLGRLLADHKIAMDAVAVVVNHSNPVAKLSVEDLAKIYTGSATWSQYGWSGNNARIDKFSGPPDGGTYAFFKDRVLMSEEFAEDVTPIVGVDQMLKMVENNRSAIAFISASDVLNHPNVRAMRITTVFDDKGSLPVAGGTLNVNAIRRGEYPLTRYVYLVTAGDITEPQAKLIDIMRSEDARSVFARYGLLGI